MSSEVRDDGFEYVTRRVEWYAELGWCDNGGVGYWSGTKESKVFATKAQAQAHMDSHPDVHIVKFGNGMTEQRPRYSMGLCRVRRDEVDA